jgi:PhzF family phenazine biosynthesis protein
MGGVGREVTTQRAVSCRPAMHTIGLYLVDAFTAVPFRGNPASVCLLDREREIDDATMQAVAAEMNHSETAFVRPLEGPPDRSTRFALRWFTPKVEVPLCGHATLASATVVFREARNQAGTISFETRSGTLTARRQGDAIALDFPVADIRPAPVSADVLRALGIDQCLSSHIARSGRSLLLHVADASTVRDLRPEFARLVRARGDDTFLGIIVTAAGDSGYDFVSRYFAPWVGIDEDPVTGSAHCALAPYWSSITGKSEMRAHQASARGGDIIVRMRGDRVDLVGEAVVLASGELRLPD